MRVTRTAYEVRGWGVGEVWVEGDVVVAHDFDFGLEATGEVRVVPLGTKATFLEARPEPASGKRGDVAGEVVAGIRRLLEGEEVGFGDVELDLDWCTGFQRAVIEALRGVPRGEVVSYGELAALAGYPRAQRAAASVCAQNRFAFLVPCHRVVAAGGIGGYGSAGVAVKRRLLALEGVRL